MFDYVSFSDKVLRFHTSSSADQAGTVTAVRQAGVTLTPDSISLGKYGPFGLPPEVRDAREFRQLMELTDGAIRIPGLSKSPRKRPNWPILTYAYRLYADHIGVNTDRELPPVLARMIESKRQLWNAMCEHCQRSIEEGQTITTEVVDSLAAEVTTILTAFNNSLGYSKDKIAFPKDDATQAPAQRVVAYGRFVSRLHRLAEEGKPVPGGLEMLVDAKLKQYPYDWSHFREFGRNILPISAELTKSMVIPASIATPVIETYRAAFKRRRSLKLKGFDGIPHQKDARSFDWFHAVSFGSGGIKVTRLNLKGSSSLRLGEPIPPQSSGHPLMQGRKAALRLLRPITFSIEEQEVTFAMMMHRPLPENGLLKQWRLLYRDGEYWVNFMLEIPPYAEASSDAGGVAGFDLNWRVLPAGGILFGMVTDGDEDTMIVFNMDRSSRASDEGGMIETYSEGGFHAISLGVGPSRWGRNNLAKNVNYGVPDTFAGTRKIRELRDKAKDELKMRIDRMLGGEAPSSLSLCGARGLKRLALQLNTTHPEVSAEISRWAVHDEDILRVMRKLSGLLEGRVKRGYDQLAHHLCRKLSGKGITRIAIKENFLRAVAEADKKYQPAALQNSARNRQAVGPSNWINALEHISAKYGIVLSRRNAAYATSSCRFCKTICEFGPHRTVQCPGCSRVIDQDQNAAHNLRNAELQDADTRTPTETVIEHGEPAFSWTLTIGRATPDGKLHQTRDLLLTATEKEPAKVNADC
jgi:hypothetical protein